MGKLVEKLQDKDDKKAYALSKEIIAVSAVTDEYYSCFHRQGGIQKENYRVGLPIC